MNQMQSLAYKYRFTSEKHSIDTKTDEKQRAVLETRSFDSDQKPKTLTLSGYFGP